MIVEREMEWGGIDVCKRFAIGLRVGVQKVMDFESLVLYFCYGSYNADLMMLVQAKLL